MIYTFQCCGQRFKERALKKHLKAAHDVNFDKDKIKCDLVRLTMIMTVRVTCKDVSYLVEVEDEEEVEG